ncbi:bifunctional biotin--[acetyl-CoA-carboxylase] ligase/biotin operon repressor BirA [Rheinheimera salexigens]|uniref:Bifunctional ligase/repressor BirA n=1 Tax=Rheinheimera salexigens TaxID=1628148 RepID=A0A1E7Q210_9GAMM|nr:bifunctional biotin--[acetyl-CoA-carboxylase] ligase/biotin operon repressor BirA [Rheinheimera salexigens]OEY68166.1 biotin--[acetyl-CoA-carboxylase] ligase [Rheinheimera salexigens]
MSKSSLIIIRTLLSRLSNGEFCSGQILADELGVSRTAVANYINQLQQLGLDIYSVRGRGYCFAAAITLLDAAQINIAQGAKRPQVLVHEITDSTNSQLQQRIKAGLITELGATIVAEAQTAGRGRRGRNWYSPFGTNLYFSMYWRLAHGMQAAMGLSLVVGLAIVRTLRQHYGVDAKLKWPNDVYINEQKVAGILVELSGQVDADCDAIIGIGLNIHMPSTATDNIDQPFTTLSQHTTESINRNQLIINLQTELIAILTEFSQSGFSCFVSEFNKVNQYQDQAIKVISTTEKVGICRGVDKQGALLLETTHAIEPIYGGEISVRGHQ